MRATAHYQDWLDAAQARTAQLVEREWPAIEAVALALESRVTLSPMDIRGIVQRARNGS